jgi:hypothetical protein
LARNPRLLQEPEERDWTPESIRIAVRKIRRRLDDLAAFNPLEVTRRNDPRIGALEAAIGETLSDIFGPNGRSYRRYQAAATLDTAGINMNGTPHREVIEGLVHGKERAIELLRTAIRFFEETMQDDSPKSPSTKWLCRRGL